MMDILNGEPRPGPNQCHITLIMNPRQDGSGLMDLSLDHDVPAGWRAVRKCLLMALDLSVQGIVEEAIQAQQSRVEVPGIMFPPGMPGMH